MKKNFLASINSFLSKITTISFVVFCVVQIFLGIITSIYPVEVNAESQQNNNIFTGTFTACEFADTGAVAFLDCISQITGYTLLIGVVYFFAKIGYLFLVNFSFFDGSKASVYQIFKESINDLIVGIVLIGMPVTILAAINPLSRLLTFSFIQEMNLGERANLINVSPNLRGCPGFSACIQSCRFSREGDSLKQCVANCKSSYVDCQLCHEFIDDEGNGLRSEEYQDCINPSLPEPGNLPIDNGNILSCGENKIVTDSKGFTRLAYTVYFSQVKKPDNTMLNSGVENRSCGAASMVMAIEMARPGTFPCLDGQKLPNFTGDQNNYCLATYMWQADNFDKVNIEQSKKNDLLTLVNRNSGTCRGAFQVTSNGLCNLSYKNGRQQFASFFGLDLSNITISGKSPDQIIADIANSINSGMPLIASTGGHIFVIVGYKKEENRILVMDSFHSSNWGTGKLAEYGILPGNRFDMPAIYERYGGRNIFYIERLNPVEGSFQPVACLSSA